MFQKMIALTITSMNPLNNAEAPNRSTALVRNAPPSELRIIVMGITGSGKTEVSRQIAAQLQVAFIEGDAFHSDANRAKMQAGTPLTDEDRWTWLQTLVRECQARAADSGGFVLACSALRRVYRERLRAGLPQLRFVFLDAPAALVSERVAARAGHFMPASLVESQVATLERPDDEADALHISAAQPLIEVVAQSMSVLFPVLSSTHPKVAA